MRLRLPTRAPTTRPGSGGSVELAELEAVHRRHCRTADVRLLREAYQVAHRMHQGQTRDSGMPYITHPVAVARIIAELGLDTGTVAAALLHDTVEDTDYTIGRLRSQFGDAVADLVDGVTKLEAVHFGDAAEAETLRKMILAASADIRVLIIKVADRLHNMRTIRHKPHRSQVRTAQVTREIIIPFADRLGLYVLRRELEDLVLAVLEPDIHALIGEHLENTSAARAAVVAQAQGRLTAELRRSGIRAQIHDRPRHLHSIHREMIKNPGVPGPQNPPRLVIVVAGNTRACYDALGVVHTTWQPVPGRFKDYIAMPKYNRYQSLHTTVLGPGDEPMEALIRTHDMHRTAENGIAADLPRRGRGDESTHLQWLDRLLNWQREAIDPGDFLEALRADLTAGEITVVLADGSAVTLPAGSTCVDLAYQVDPVAADRLIGAHVNGKLVPLTTTLAGGDRVELMHARHHNAGPSPDWLTTARTAHARLYIAEALEPREPRALVDQIRAGRTALAAALHRRDRALPDDDALDAAARQAGYPDQDAWLFAIHRRELDPQQAADRLLASVDRPTAMTLADRLAADRK